MILFSFKLSANQAVNKPGEGVTIKTDRGTLHLIPLNDRAVRVRFEQKETKLYPDELIYKGKTISPSYKVVEDDGEIRVELKSLDLRYRLLPYIYSEAARVSFNGSTLTRPLVMDFAHDSKALEQRYQFMFGPSILVAPITEPEVNEWMVYLPEEGEQSVIKTSVTINYEGKETTCKL